MAMNEGYSYVERIGGGERRTVLGYLAARYPHSSPSTWSARIDQGEVLLDGKPTHADEALTPGAELRWNRPPWSEPDAPLDYDVLYEDEALLAVGKPSGLPTLPAGGFLLHTLLIQVRRLDPLATPLHRLGRGTSGLVLFARTPQARSTMLRAWREGGVEKRYRALASGAPSFSRVCVTTPIGPVAHPLLGEVFAASPTGKFAHSHVQVIEPRDEGALVDVDIETGRPHQIRIHLAAVGHPLVGDPLYGVGGAPRFGTTALPGELGYLLHAWQLRFCHPSSGKSVELEAPLPGALRRQRCA